jgi:membrane-associated protease RseP (regulator of RpoE activity)
MTGPKHLWSGDWQNESEAASADLGKHHATTPEEEPVAPAPGEPRPPRRSRRLALPIIAVVLVALVGTAFGLSALKGSSNTHHATSPTATSQPTTPAPQTTPTIPQPTTPTPQPTTPTPTVPQSTAPTPTVPSIPQPTNPTPQPTTPSPQPTTPNPQPSVSRPSTTPTATPVVNWLGMQIATVPPGAAVVETVPSGTAGDRAGLEPGDVILEVNGHAIHGAADIAAAIKGLPAGTHVGVEISYGSLLRHATVTLGAPPAVQP